MLLVTKKNFWAFKWPFCSIAVALNLVWFAWETPTQAENDSKETKYSESGSSLCEITLLMPGARLIQMISCCNQGMQKSISGLWTLKQIGYSCRTPRKISKILSKQSWFVLQHSDSTVWIWCKWHESIDILPRIYSSSCWRCNFEGLIFLAHLPFKHTAYLSIVADHVHPFIVHHLLWQLPAG